MVTTPRVEQALRNTDRQKYRGMYLDSPQTIGRDTIKKQYNPSKNTKIGYNQTISAPHMHAMCLEIMAPLIKEGSKVLGNLNSQNL